MAKEKLQWKCTCKICKTKFLTSHSGRKSCYTCTKPTAVAS